NPDWRGRRRRRQRHLPVYPAASGGARCLMSLKMSIKTFTLTQREEHITLSLPMKRMMMLGLLVAVVVVAFMTVGSRGNWDFVLPFRGTKIAAMALVAYAIAVSTVLFQTITSNRILT